MKSVLGTGAKISGANLFALRSCKTPEGFMYMIVPRHTQALSGNAPVHSVEQMIRSEKCGNSVKTRWKNQGCRN